MSTYSIITNKVQSRMRWMWTKRMSRSDYLSVVTIQSKLLRFGLLHFDANCNAHKRTMANGLDWIEVTLYTLPTLLLFYFYFSNYNPLLPTLMISQQNNFILQIAKIWNPNNI